jgi:hypothetical protein
LAAGFSSGIIPVDTTTAKYSIAVSYGGSSPAISVVDPTSWADTAVNPTTTGLPALVATGSTAYATFDGTQAGLFVAPATASTVKYWKVCTRLESSGTNATVATGLKLFCRGSAQ